MRLALLASALPFIAFAAGPISCPDIIQVSPQHLASPHQGWLPVESEDTRHRFSGITIFDGQPEEKASLAPDQETKMKGKTVSVWKLPTNPGRYYWFVCHYSGTTVSVGRPLPRALNECSVTYSATEQIDGLPKVESITCR